jgi:amino acid adenylation domain-containing protein
VFDNERLTYREVNAHANQLAHYLRKRGVGPEVPVGVCLSRSAKMIVTLLGVLKAGGAYLPLDPGYPAERLAFMLGDARVPLLLTEKRLAPMFETATTQVISLDECAEVAEESVENPSRAGTPDNLAYVIYTSGSTGLPKGVEVSHRTVVHLFSATREQIGFVEGDVWTVVHSNAFDFSVWEIWGSLLQGGRLVIVPLTAVQSPADLYSLLCREQVTVLNQTPSALRQLLLAREQQARDRDWNVRLIVCGGDALDQELAAELVNLKTPVWNFYGPTESTVWTACTLIERGAAGDLTSVGRPIADLKVYLLDDNLQPVPIGVPGELFIGGDGLARGYLNRPELTADRFLPDPYSAEPGKRLYRTGDLARYRDQGRLEILGRIDHQVKLRGFRVELGEIEVAISQHPDVAQAVALVREDRPGEKRLTAYVVAEPGRLVTAGELRLFLQQRLPEYMVPSVFVMLDELPLSRNKKVDRKQLPAPDYAAIQPGNFVAAHDPVEELLADIWARLLGLDKVARHDNFFELGGHSLLAMQVISRIREVFQVELPPRALFEMPTIAGLGQKIAALAQAEEKLQLPRLTRVNRSDRLPLSFAQQRLWFLDQLEPGLPFYNMARAFRLQGALDTVALSQALSEIVIRHESLRTSFVDDGSPYQRIGEAQPLSLESIDLSRLPEIERHGKLEKLVTEEIRQPFDLSRDPLLRAKLLKFKPDDYVLVVTLHHIAADGWSLGVLFHELSVLYNAFANGQGSPLPPLPIQYCDFAFWQRAWLQGDVLERLLSYWKKQLAGAPMVLKLPGDRSRPPAQSFRGDYQLATIPPELTGSLKELSLREGVTLFMTCLAAFQLLISRYTGQHDLVVGTDVANRDRVETEDLIGFFTNLLPLRARLSAELRFTELLRQAKETTLEAYAHQDLPFEKLVEELRPPRDLGRNPLVQILLVMQNQPNRQIDLHKMRVSRFEVPIESSRFDLVLFLSESDNGLEGLWLYNPDLFDEPTIARLSSNYQKLLESIVRDPTARLDSFDILTEQTKNKRVEKKDLQESRLNQLRSVRRKSVDLSQVGDVRTASLQAGQTLPLVIEPASGDIDLAEWAKGNKETLDQYLLQHGAILFRGFAVDSVDEFERAATAIFPELFGEYGDLPREEMGGKVYGSTPYPSDETILFHNESSHMHRWPMLIWFYCVKAADQGGESPIVDCRQLYQSMDPAIRDSFEQKGLMYVRNFTDGLDVSWQEFFHTNDKSTVEQYCRQNSIAWEWKANHGLRTRQICPAVVRHPQTSELVFFNQVQLHHIYCLSPAVRDSLLSMMKEEDLPRNVYYGDGSPIDNSVMEYLVELTRKKCVSFPWQVHDVLMLNNMLVAHSRNPFVGERKIVVAMANLISNEQVEQPHSADV